MDIGVLFFLKFAICFIVFLAVVLETRKISIKIVTLLTIILFLSVSYYKTHLYNEAVSEVSNTLEVSVPILMESNRNLGRDDLTLKIRDYLNNSKIDNCTIKVNGYQNYGKLYSNEINARYEIEIIIGRFYKVKTINVYRFNKDIKVALCD